MNSAKLMEVKVAARRILRDIELLETAKKETGCGTLPKQHGAVRRASMDLTRALAEMRKPG